MHVSGQDREVGGRLYPQRTPERRKQKGEPRGLPDPEALPRPKEMTRPVSSTLKAVPGRATTVVCPTEPEPNVADSREDRRKEVAQPRSRAGAVSLETRSSAGKPSRAEPD
jgi:hypothetical protein